MNRWDKKAWLFLLVAVSLWGSALAFAIGAENALRNGVCLKQRYVDYFPPYLAGCKLFQLRWAEDGHPIDPENL